MGSHHLLLFVYSPSIFYDFAFVASQFFTSIKMASADGLRPRSPVKHLFLTLKVDFSKLKDFTPRTKLVTLKIDPEKLATFVDNSEDESMEASEEEQQEKEEPPLEDRTAYHLSPLYALTNNHKTRRLTSDPLRPEIRPYSTPTQTAFDTKHDPLPTPNLESPTLREVS